MSVQRRRREVCGENSRDKQGYIGNHFYFLSRFCWKGGERRRTGTLPEIRIVLWNANLELEL